jgi:hypothetical protein
MSNFCFFTDADATNLLNVQDSSGTFGAVSDTEFRVTSLHTAVSNPRAFAVCDGTVAVQKDSTQPDIVSLILKPKDQPPVGNRINFVPIKYIIYKGVVKGSLISGSGVADKSNNQLTSRAHATQEAMNREAEVLLEKPANSITATPSANFLGYDIIRNDNDSLDKIFYRQNNSSFELLSVKAGDHIGTFDKNLFGLEIVLDDVRANANFILVKHIETKLQAPVATASTDSQLFKRRHQKESAISFMDPCAFFGSFFQYGGVLQKPVKLRYRLSTDTIDVEKETKDSDLHKAKSSEIYEKILVHFANKNAVYIDIRNELNTSINFYAHYDNNIKLTQADDEIVDKDYYGNSGWPLLVLRPGDFDLHGQNNDSDKDVIKIEIALPNPGGENAAPLVYFSQGYHTKIRRNKVLRGEKRYVRLATADDYTESFQVAVANIANEAKITPVSQYIRIKYLKLVLQGASSGIVPRASNYLDLLFLPFRMKIPFAVTANSKSRVYQEDAFLALLAESGCESAGAVGIAEDTKTLALFTYAGDKLKTKGTSRLQTISLASEIATETHYLNLVRDRYKREKLVQGKIPVGPLPYPSYFRFIDATPATASALSDANLRDEFMAVLIEKSKFVEMAFAHSFSFDYDIFIRFSNEIAGDSAGVEFTSYDLLLEGYIDDGTSISLGTFNPGIKVYSFGKSQSLIFLDKDVTYDESAPLDVLPSCAGSFSQDELALLKTFIDGLDSTPPPFKDLYAKVFFIDGDIRNKIEVTDVGPPGDKYELINPFTVPVTLSNPKPPGELPKGFLAEACTIFTLYKLEKQLAFDTNADKQKVDIDHPDKKPIYQALKQILRGSGFDLKPNSDTERLEFNEMMNPNRSIGVRGWLFTKETTSPTKKTMYDLIKARKFSSNKSLLNDDEIRNNTKAILEEYRKIIGRFVKEESACAYKILSGEALAPVNLFLASGDGSTTSGLLEVEQNNTGVLLFDYEYDGTAGVKERAERTFDSLKTDRSTSVHLTMFGLDKFEDENHQVIPSDSTIKVIKDRIAYVFKASFANKIIRPVDGTEAQSQARYNATDQLFYTETASGTVTLAYYDLKKRDLIFLGEDKNFSFKVELTSFHHPDAPADRAYDEVSVSINVIEGPKLHIFEFEAEDLFDNDVFAVTGAKIVQFKDALLKDPKDVEAIDFMIERLTNVPNIPISISLRGNFIGEKLETRDPLTHSKVKTDPKYRFFFTRDEGREKETDEDPASYKPLRYSIGRVAITDFSINITIDSFVSPLWSRLDNKIFELPIPSPAQVAKKKELDELTHYYTINSSDAYVDHLGGDPRPTDTAHPKLPSYNPILSGLRSFGLAVALKDFLVDRAAASNLDFFQVETSLQEKINDAKVLKNDLLGIGADIEFKHFTGFQP